MREQDRIVILTAHQYATLISPKMGDTAVCGSSIFVRITGGGYHWLPISIGLRAPQPPYMTSVAGWLGVISSDNNRPYTNVYAATAKVLQ